MKENETQIDHMVWEGDNQFDIESFIGVDELDTAENPDVLLIPTVQGLVECDLGDAVIKSGAVIGVQRKGAFNIQ